MTEIVVPADGVGEGVQRGYQREQARLFRDLLHEEIEVLTARIDTTRAQGGRLGAEDPEPGARLGEARQLVARLTAPAAQRCCG
ncbi:MULTISPECIES: hypothetical protein [unclassified Rhodococcus (in: high G+C Gram-positive bacteria)]|uniref:hypothetical protein n=1 Tax=unclassified Rhodococcus (in: high G+C Gram-positive bacteria) TaxID=192944 RepID=UPI00163A02D5|nr:MULTISPECIES: hypothetical protein [unclassified Rhodococcus (in: high G+C Gram-positive bacteria)]MBC2642644.1 hypothetical protein [Rhodococcus sp. 3A]MBC2892614.1 hypothetical protein [Rhodococcus sp. 4CII]